MRIRQANPADVPPMMNLERQNPAAAHWPRQQYESLFVSRSNSKPSERSAWVVEDENKVESGVESKAESEAPQILAFLVAHRVDAEWELENIVVVGTARRRGLGTRLLGELIGQARSAQGSEIFLEVRESNHDARALYRKMGFKEAGVRKRYYSDPPEDAILCRLGLY